VAFRCHRAERERAYPYHARCGGHDIGRGQEGHGRGHNIKAVEKAATDKGANHKSTAGEAAVTGVAVGAAGDLPALGKVPSQVVGTKRAVTPSGSTLSAKRPYRGVWKPRFGHLGFL
jgi:hypothetical protein